MAVNQTSIYYDERKILEVKKLRQALKTSGEDNSNQQMQKISLSFKQVSYSIGVECGYNSLKGSSTISTQRNPTYNIAILLKVVLTWNS
jgi:hypothetical protein